MAEHGRRFGVTAPLFDPLRGTVVREPGGSGSGWWVGAPGAFHDVSAGLFYLTYRIREPRPVRGGITRLAVSRDGIHFDDIFECRKEQLDSASIERCAVIRTTAGDWRWFVSYVDPDTNQWRIDVVAADQPDRFDPAQRQKVFVAADLEQVEGVKDPYLFLLGDAYYLIASIALTVPLEDGQQGDKHATGDIFNTGLTVSSTGLAVSADCTRFEWVQVTDAPRGSWDRYCFRVNSLLYTPPVFTAFYDGSASVDENYEEKCGLAQSFDLMSYRRISLDGPRVTVPHATTSVRYVDCLPVAGRIYYYYEMVRPDGSHELRVAVV